MKFCLLIFDREKQFLTFGEIVYDKIYLVCLDNIFFVCDIVLKSNSFPTIL